MQSTAFTCDRCLAPLPPGVSVCPNCGQVFSASVPTAPPQQAYIQPRQTAGKGMPTIAIIGIVGVVGCLPMIGIVAAIMFPVFAIARDRARESVSMNNLKQIGLATLQYELEHNNKYPPMDSMDHFKSALSTYVPSQNGRDIFTEPGGAPYALNTSLSNQDVSSQGDPAQTVLAKETMPHRLGMIAVVYGDGHVRTTYPATGAPSSTSSSGSN